MKVSVIIPAFNEKSTIAEIVQRVRAVKLHAEIIIVDDGSTDGTREVLAGLLKGDDLVILCHPVNRGKGAAIRTAVAWPCHGVLVSISGRNPEVWVNKWRMLMASFPSLVNSGM